MWGGLSGFLTIEDGTREDIVRATNEALDTMSPGGGFILSPVDNVRDDSDRVWKNVETFIDAWKAWTRTH